MTTPINTTQSIADAGMPENASDLGPANKTSSDSEPHLALTASIDPANQLVTATAVYTIPLDQLDKNDPVIWLNKKLKISEVTVNNQRCSLKKLDHDKYPRQYHRDAKPYRMKGIDWDSASSPLQITISYEGKIKWPMKHQGGITPSEIELALYASWFPEIKGVDHFTHELDITLPQDFQVISNGELVTPPDTQGPNTRWHFVDNHTDRYEDVNLLASTRFASTQIHDAQGNTVDVYQTGSLTDKTANLLATETQQILSYFNSAFGPAESNAHIVIMPRSGQCYSRSPIIVLSANLFKNPDRLPQTMLGNAHELAHYWFGIADATTTNDWINEGMAQYAGLLAMEHLHGEERVTNEFQQATLNTGTRGWMLDNPIAQTLRTSNDGGMFETIGMLAFARLHEVMGDENFFGMMSELRQLSLEHPVTTDDLIRIANERSGSETTSIITSLILNKPELPCLNLDWRTEPTDSGFELIFTITPSVTQPLSEIPVQIDFGDGTHTTTNLDILPNQTEYTLPVRQQPVACALDPFGRAGVLSGKLLTDYHWTELGSLEWLGPMDRINSQDTQTIAKAPAHIAALELELPGNPGLIYFNARLAFLAGDLKTALSLFDQALLAIGDGDFLLPPKNAFSLKGLSLAYKALCLDALQGRKQARPLLTEIATHSEPTWMTAKFIAKAYKKKRYNPKKHP